MLFFVIFCILICYSFGYSKIKKTITEFLKLWKKHGSTFCYFKGRNFRGKKLSRFSRILGEFAKVISAKNSAKADSRKFFLAKKIWKTVNLRNFSSLKGLKLEGIVRGINIDSVFENERLTLSLVELWCRYFTLIVI